MPIANRVTDDDAPFTLASLVGDAGVGANGEKLVATLTHYYPPELEAATLKRVNARLTERLGEDGIASVAELAGAPDDSDLNVKVRGGEVRASDAVVVYAFHDESGQLWKGCFPYSDVGKASSDRHISQRESLAGSPEAEAYAKAQAKARAAQGDSGPTTRALKERIAELEGQVADGGSGESEDPVTALADASADELVKLMAAHPERADAIKAFESATRGEKARKTVLEWEPPKGDSGDGP